MKISTKCLFLLSLLTIFATSCTTENTVKIESENQGNEDSGIEDHIPSLSETWSDFFDIGAAIEPYQFQVAGSERDLLVKHFSSLTAENVMKQLSLHPERDKWNFGPADKLVDFALSEGKKVRGHCLVWHHEDQTAKWMFTNESGEAASREEMLASLENHIKTVVERYKGKIYAWDVVNEPIDVSTSDNMRHTEWYELIGPDYIEHALRFAHEADPDALLFINDYSTFEKAKGDALYKLVKDLKDKGVPVHGLGMQVHINLGYPDLQAIEQAIEKFRTLGVELHITELDMSLYSHEYEELNEAPRDYLIHQAHRYKELFELFKTHSDVIGNVTFWGFNDSHTWLKTYPVERPDWPLIFDDQMQAKPAFWGLVDPEQLPDDPGLASVNREAYVYSAPYGTVEIDGEIDSLWEIAPSVRTEEYVMPDDGAFADVKLLWDEENLYFLADVTDSLLSDKSKQVHERDSFEIFLDENNGKSTSYEEDDYQFRINYSNARSYGGYARATMITSKTIITDRGYRIEGAITFRSVKPEPGLQLGLDLQVNDDQGAGVRSSIAKWNDRTNESWRNTKGWGILELSSP